MSSPSSNSDVSDQPRVDDFSDKEAAVQTKFRVWRSRVMAPVLLPLQKTGLRSDHITLVGVALLIPYVVFFFVAKEWAPLFLVLYTIMDGIDGAYARLTNTQSNGGALADVVADQLGMFVTVLLVIYAGLAEPTLAAYYLGIYIVMVALSVAQNYLRVPLQPIIRTKYPLYIAVAAWAWFDVAIQFNWLFGIAAAIMTFTSIQSFLRLKRGLDQPPQLQTPEDD